MQILFRTLAERQKFVFDILSGKARPPVGTKLVDIGSLQIIGREAFEIGDSASRTAFRRQGGDIKNPLDRFRACGTYWKNG